MGHGTKKVGKHCLRPTNKNEFDIWKLDGMDGMEHSVLGPDRT